MKEGRSVQARHGFSYEGAQKVSMRNAQCPIMANLPPDVCSRLIAQAVGPGETGRMVAVQVFGGEGYGAALGAGKSHIAAWTFQVKVR